MDKKSLENLLLYASYSGALMKLDSEGLPNLIENESPVSFTLNGEDYTIDFSDNLERDAVIKMVKRAVPITSVIDLTDEALKLGIVTDVSSDYKKAEFESFNDYIGVVEADYFCFKINSESFDDTVYKITYKRENHDIKKKIEYASRTSLFIDTLIKRIMAKYNILLVRKASLNSEMLPELPVEENTYAEYEDTADSSFDTDMIQNQLKLLINYRDNFNNASCSENVIDDIFISITDNQVSYGFYNIGQSDEEPVYDVINETVSADDIDSLLRIRSLINDNDVKFKMFETLRANKNTHLSRLIEERIAQYDSELNSDPKIEFTVTPLSIYCNHIVKKTVHYHIGIKSEQYKNYIVPFTVIFNPADPSSTEYEIYADGEMEMLKPGRHLVLAFDGINDGTHDLNPMVTSEDYATKLYGLADRYNNKYYKDIYFLNEDLVKVIDGNLVPYDGKPDEFTYLKNQVVKGEISGKYYFIKDTIKIKSNDILGVDFISDQIEDKYIHTSYARKCDVCGHVFGATDDVWNMYKAQHKLINVGNGASCCNHCAGTVVNEDQVILYSKGYKEYYFDDYKNPSRTAICITCDEPSEALIYVKKGSKRGKCKVCGKYYCPDHINPETNICVNCSGELERNDTLSDGLRKNVIKSLSPKDMLVKDISFNYYKAANSVWAIVKKEKKTSIYYFAVDDNELFVHLLGKNVKRGGK
ncbi:MAG: hypothetical protein K6A63_02975 [Acholeplasmatales bacterium]|nr:hypothetical protein [Acholeplasmatales bacterium]